MTTNKESPDKGAGALLPCPSGHDEAKLYHEKHHLTDTRSQYPINWCYVECKHRHENGSICGWHMGGFPTAAEAIAAWNTRAQDSGQGEAVAIGQVVASKSRGIETEWYNYLPKPGTKLFSHPPKPAQDASGKGVTKEHHIAFLESMSDDDWEYLFLVRPDLKVRLRAVFDAAKPAQVGQKDAQL